jgi:EpsD family peptidyl-prolyl cis-trans isomerase
MMSIVHPLAARRAKPFPLRALLVAMTCGVLLVGCGNRKGETASQTAAKVNKEEITVHQINFVLQQQRGLRQDQADAASRQILERLIDQELALQKAQDMKLDRDPRVVQQVEAARREIVARAYIDRLGADVPRPTADEVKKYYEEKPALFKERRIYNIQEIAVEAKPEQVDTLRAQLQQAKSVQDFIDYLKANNFRFAGNQAVRPAEQIPLTLLDTFAKMRDGQAILSPTPNGAQVVVLASSRSEPVEEAKAAPAIEQFLLNDAKRRLAETDLKTMRASAKIEYVGKYAAPAASAAASAAGLTVSPGPIVSDTAPTISAAASTSNPAVPARSASGLGADDISKGMGLKR